MIQFKELTIEGFGSIIKPITIKFRSSGILVIRGENGAGKSTLLAALCWVLFGKLIKKGSTIEPWKSTSDGYRGTMVSVTFIKIENGKSTQYEVIRCMKYKGNPKGLAGKNHAYIIKNCNLTKQEGKAAPAVHREVSRILGYSFELFKHAVVFPQEAARLMEETGPGKKEIFEEAFDATFIAKARSLVEEEVTTLVSTKARLEDKLPHIDEMLDNIQDAINDIGEDERVFNLSKKMKLKKINEDIQLLNDLRNSKASMEAADMEEDHTLLVTKIEEIETQLSKLSKAETNEFKLSMELNGMKCELETLDTEIVSIGKELLTGKKKCSKCGAVTDIKNREELKTTLEKLKIQRPELHSNVKLMTKLYAKAEKKLIKYNNLQISLSSHKGKLRELKTKMDSIEDSLRALQEIPIKIDLLKKQKVELKNQVFQFPDAKYRSLKDKQISKLTEKAETESELVHVKNKLEIRTWALDEALSNKGIKSYLFNIMLGKVNKYLEFYEPFVGFKITCHIDMKSANKNIELIVTFRGGLASYNDLSKGQKQLANTVVIFALSDVLMENKPINILILDEIFESLSENNVEIVSNIIQQKAQTKGIHLISHLTTFQPTNCKTITLTLDKKFQTKLG